MATPRRRVVSGAAAPTNNDWQVGATAGSIAAVREFGGFLVQSKARLSNDQVKCLEAAIALITQRKMMIVDDITPNEYLGIAP